MIDWTPELEEEIAQKLEAKSLLTLCRENPHWPDRTSIIAHMAKSPEFSTRCARARTEHSQAILETVQDEVLNASTKEQAYVANVKAAHAQWYATKLLPKMYGDKQQLEVSGGLDLAERLARARKRAE